MTAKQMRVRCTNPDCRKILRLILKVQYIEKSIQFECGVCGERMRLTVPFRIFLESSGGQMSTTEINDLFEACLNNFEEMFKPK